MSNDAASLLERAESIAAIRQGMEEFEQGKGIPLKEAEEKLRAVKKWALAIEHKAAKAMGPCTALSSTLSKLTPQALARLDQMLDSLDDYLRPGATGPSA